MFCISAPSGSAMVGVGGDTVGSRPSFRIDTKKKKKAQQQVSKITTGGVLGFTCLECLTDYEIQLRNKIQQQRRRRRNKLKKKQHMA